MGPPVPHFFSQPCCFARLPCDQECLLCWFACLRSCFKFDAGNFFSESTCFCFHGWNFEWHCSDLIFIAETFCLTLPNIILWLDAFVWAFCTQNKGSGTNTALFWCPDDRIWHGYGLFRRFFRYKRDFFNAEDAERRKKRTWHFFISRRDAEYAEIFLKWFSAIFASLRETVSFCTLNFELW
jgi:hypothetical protein